MSQIDNLDFIKPIEEWLDTYDLSKENESIKERCIAESIASIRSGRTYNNLQKIIPYLEEYHKVINPFRDRDYKVKSPEEYPDTIKFEIFGPEKKDDKVGYSITDTKYDKRFNNDSNNNCSCIIYYEEDEQILIFSSRLSPYVDTQQEIMHCLGLKKDGSIFNRLIIVAGATWQLDLLTGILSVKEGRGSLPEEGIPVPGQIDKIIEYLKVNTEAAKKIIVDNMCVPQSFNIDNSLSEVTLVSDSSKK